MVLEEINNSAVSNQKKKKKSSLHSIRGGEREERGEGDGDERPCDGWSGLCGSGRLHIFKSPRRPRKHPPRLFIQDPGTISGKIRFDRTLLRKILVELALVGIGVLGV